MKRKILIAFTSVIALSATYALISYPDFDFFGHESRDGHPAEAATPEDGQSGSKEGVRPHEEGGGEHDDGEKGQGEHGSSELRLSVDQVKLAGIESVEAERGQVDLTVQLTGEVEVNRDRVVQVVPRVPGIVRSVNSLLGDHVEKGAVMTVLDSRELADTKSAYVAAREGTKLAQSTFEREEQLWKKRISSEQEYLNARAALTEAQIEERAAAQKLLSLGYTTAELNQPSERTGDSLTRYDVVAPQDGTIIEKNVTAGASVDERESIYRIADLETVWVIANVYEKHIARISKGQPASVVTDAYPEGGFKGRINWVADTLEEKTRTLKVRIEVDNGRRQLKPGMFVRANVVVASKDGVMVPASSIRRQGGETVVFIDEGNGRFERREVSVGEQTGDKVEIQKGVKAGERVVAAGSFILKSELEKEGFGGGHGH